jgi:hypothetical protein
LVWFAGQLLRLSGTNSCSAISARQAGNLENNPLQLPAEIWLNAGCIGRRFLFDQLSDPQFWQQASDVALVPLILLALLAWLVSVVCTVGQFFCAAPERLPRFFDLRLLFPSMRFRDWLPPNRGNVVLFGNLLTPKGLTLRRWSHVAMAIFVACLAILLLLVSLAPKS